MGIVKGNAYGHGAVPVAKHLKSIGVPRLAVATIDEAKELRHSGIAGPIHVFGLYAHFSNITSLLKLIV